MLVEIATTQEIEMSKPVRVRKTPYYDQPSQHELYQITDATNTQALLLTWSQGRRSVYLHLRDNSTGTTYVVRYSDHASHSQVTRNHVYLDLPKTDNHVDQAILGIKALQAVNAAVDDGNKSVWQIVRDRLR